MSPRPLRDLLFVKRLNAEKSKGGILLTEPDRTNLGEVLYAGPEATVKPGSTVILGHRWSEAKVNGEDVLVFREDPDVFAVIDP